MIRRNTKTPLLLVGIVAGAAAQYFLDPQQGRSRRVQVKDQCLAAARRRGRRLEQRREWAQGRAKGMVYESTRPIRDEAPGDDRTLVDKVRSEVLGAERYQAYTINIDAVDGVVSLRGQVDHPEEIRDLREAVAAVPGVRAVESFLHLPGTSPPNVE